MGWGSFFEEYMGQLHDESTLWDDSFPADNYVPDDVIIHFVQIKHGTELATLFDTKDGDVWVPKSQMTIDHRRKEVTVSGFVELSYAPNLHTGLHKLKKLSKK